MMQELKLPLFENKPYLYTFRKISGTEQFHIVDPTVIKKVESSANYFLNYEEPVEIFSTDLPSLRNEMGSINKDLCTSEVEVTPYLAQLTNRKIPLTFFRSPNCRNQKICIFLHGGGFIGGSTSVLKNQCKFLAEQSGACVISIDYRLAPEDPFPAAFYDCKEVIKWIISHASDWNLSTEKMTICGESAGGNLAMICSLCEIGKYISLTIPIYGAMDLSKPNEIDYWSYDKYPVVPEHEKYVITRLNRFRHLNSIMLEMYLDNSINIKNPEISPLYAKDYSHLSKVVIIESEYDYFRLSNDLLAEKLMDSDIPCKVIRYQGMDHGFFDRLGYCEQTKDCILEIAKQIKSL